MQAAYGQSFNIATSIKLWGRTPSAAQVDLEYSSFMATMIFMPGTYWDRSRVPTSHYFFGLFYAPDVELQKLTITPMVGVFDKPYPNMNGVRMNLGIETSVQIHPEVDLYYRHISNGGTGNINPGIDVVGLKFALINDEQD